MLEPVAGSSRPRRGAGLASETDAGRGLLDGRPGLLPVLAGREIQVERLRGALLATSLAGFAISFALGLGAALLLHAVGLIKTPLLLAIIFVATSLSVIIVPLKDANQIDTDWGQQVIAAAAIAEFGAVILLSFFYSGENTGPSTEILHLSLFVLVAALVLFSISRGAQLRLVSEAMERLEGTSAQIRVRAATSRWSPWSPALPASSAWRPSWPRSRWA